MYEPICLITPPSGFLLDERVFITLGILKVAAVLEKSGYAVEHIDLSGVENYTDVVRAHAANSSARIFGVTATTPQLPAAVKIAETLRQVKPNARIILGGPHVTLAHAAARREKKKNIKGRGIPALDKLSGIFDVLVVGDGEIAIFAAIREDSPKIVDGDDPKTNLFMTDNVLEETPWPARHLVDVDSYHYKIEGARSLSMIGQLGCPYSCLGNNTIVFTEDGPVEIAKLNKPEIATPSGVSRVTAIINNGIRQTYRIVVEGGLSIRATEDHRFLCVNGEDLVWKRLDKIKPNDFMAIRQPERRCAKSYVELQPPVLPEIPPGGFARREHHTIPKVLDNDLAWLCGFIVGDGSLPTDGRPEFHVCLTTEVKERLICLIKKYFNVEVGVSKASNTDKMEHGWVRSRTAREVLIQSIGIDPKDKLKIPKIFWQSPQSVLESFLDGLFAADGYEDKTGPYLTTASEQLAHHVAYAILSVGRGCPFILKIDNSSGGFSNGVSYRVGVLANDRIPCNRRIYRSKKSGKYHWRTAGKRFGIRRRTIRKAGLSHPLDKEGWYYARVMKIETLEFEEVYDITVPGDESFVANGFIAHNCSFCGGRESPMLRRIRTRTPASIVAETRHLHEKYNAIGIMYYDDELNVSKSIIELMNGIADLSDELGVEFKLRGFVKAELFTEAQAEAMYRAGFRWLLTGFEAGSPRILDNINKKSTREENTRALQIAHKHGIKVKALMSVGHPGESSDTIRETKEWLLEEKPDDFDCTIITVYPGTPYHDHAVETSPGIWTYTAPRTGDKLHSIETSFDTEGGYYKGKPGEYKSFTFTDNLTPEQIVQERDALEAEVREKLKIPFNAGAPGVRYEASMGNLPGYILRQSGR